MKTIKLSEMSVGDKCIWLEENAICELKEGGVAKGCDHDLYLAYVCGEQDIEAAEWGNLPFVVIDDEGEKYIAI